MFGRIKYLILLKSGIADVYSHKYMKIKVDPDNGLSLRKNIKYF